MVSNKTPIHDSGRPNTPSGDKMKQTPEDTKSAAANSKDKAQQKPKQQQRGKIFPNFLTKGRAPVNHPVEQKIPQKEIPKIVPPEAHTNVHTGTDARKKPAIPSIPSQKVMKPMEKVLSWLDKTFSPAWKQMAQQSPPGGGKVEKKLKLEKMTSGQPGPKSAVGQDGVVPKLPPRKNQEENTWFEIEKSNDSDARPMFEPGAVSRAMMAADRRENADLLGTPRESADADTDADRKSTPSPRAGAGGKTKVENVNSPMFEPTPASRLVMTEQREANAALLATPRQPADAERERTPSPRAGVRGKTENTNKEPERPVRPMFEPSPASKLAIAEQRKENAALLGIGNPIPALSAAPSPAVLAKTDAIVAIGDSKRTKGAVQPPSVGNDPTAVQPVTAAGKGNKSPVNVDSEETAAKREIAEKKAFEEARRLASEVRKF